MVSLLLLLLLLGVTRFDRLPASRLEVPRVRFKTTFAQVLLPSQRNRDGDFQRRVFDEVITGPVARRAHVRVHVVPVLQLALRALRLQRVEVVQVAQLEVLIRPTSGLWERGERGGKKGATGLRQLSKNMASHRIIILEEPLFEASAQPAVCSK